jgi:hypothetical protein
MDQQFKDAKYQYESHTVDLESFKNDYTMDDADHAFPFSIVRPSSSVLPIAIRL